MKPEQICFSVNAATRIALTYSELEQNGRDERCYVHNLDEQPYGDDDEPHYVVAWLRDRIPMTAGNSVDSPEPEHFDTRRVWVSTVPVSECTPMNTRFREVHTDDPCWYELADLAEKEVLDQWA